MKIMAFQLCTMSMKPFLSVNVGQRRCFVAEMVYLLFGNSRHDIYRRHGYPGIFVQRNAQDRHIRIMGDLRNYTDNSLDVYDGRLE